MILYWIIIVIILTYYLYGHKATQGLIGQQTLSILTILVKITNLINFIRSGRLYTIFTSLSWIYQTHGLYKVCWSLCNISQPCVIYQTCRKSPGLWTLYGVIELQTLWNFCQPCKIYRTGGLYKVCGLCILSTSVAKFAQY